MTLKEMLLYRKKLATTMAKHTHFCSMNKTAAEDRQEDLELLEQTKQKWLEYLKLSEEMIRVKNILAETNMQVGVIHKLNQIAELQGCIALMRSIECNPSTIERNQGYNTAPKEVKTQVAFTEAYASEYIAGLEDKIAKLHNEIDTLNFTTKVDFRPNF